MRPGKRERALIRDAMELKRAQHIRAALVPSTPGRARLSLDASLKGFVVPSMKREWDYLPKRVNGVARHSRGRTLEQV